MIYFMEIGLIRGISNTLLASLLSLFTFHYSLAENHGNEVARAIDSQLDWHRAAESLSDFRIVDGMLFPQSVGAVFTSHVMQFPEKQSFEAIRFGQPGYWGEDQWKNAGNLGPTEEADAPVFISPAAGKYWYLNAVSGGGEYNAWHSTDFVNWTDYGNVTEKDWVTSAEYADGHFFIYYDEPNDEDPHLIRFTDLRSAEGRIEHGLVFDDPSHGSDIAAFRDLDGRFHLIYEDWSAINARAHSWDSQVAGRTSSPDGIHGFTNRGHQPVIDLRGQNKGRKKSYQHPNGTYEYEVHAGPHDAFGDFEMIRVGDRYYLFCDFHPEGVEIGLGYWMSDSLDRHFDFGGVIRRNVHPDPSAGFAEGEFVMFVQGGDDLKSSGPWVDAIEARAGVDQDGDGIIDVWTEWSRVRESYGRIDGFAKVFSAEPAELDLSRLPAGFGIRFMVRFGAVGAILDRVAVVSGDV